MPNGIFAKAATVLRFHKIAALARALGERRNSALQSHISRYLWVYALADRRLGRRAGSPFPDVGRGQLVIYVSTGWCGPHMIQKRESVSYFRTMVERWTNVGKSH